MIIDKVKMNDNNKIPLINLGISLSTINTVTKDSIKDLVKNFLNSGYRSLDVSNLDKFNKEIVDVFKETNLPRKEMFLTTKVCKQLNKERHNEKSINNYINELLVKYETSYIDLVLACNQENSKVNLDMWQALEKLKEKKIIKSIGVCCYETYDLLTLLKNCKKKPVLNKTQVSIMYFNHELFLNCVKNNIVTCSSFPIIKDFKQIATEEHQKKIQEISKRLNLTENQVMISFLLGAGVLPSLDISDKSLLKDVEKVLRMSNINHQVYRHLAFHTGRKKLTNT